MKANPDLCERPYCREPWTWYVSGWNYRGRKGWTLRVCDDHAAMYRDVAEKPELQVGTSISVQSRQAIKRYFAEVAK
jgi:hypothetical protein